MRVTTTHHRNPPPPPLSQEEEEQQQPPPNISDVTDQHRKEIKDKTNWAASSMKLPDLFGPIRRPSSFKCPSRNFVWHLSFNQTFNVGPWEHIEHIPSVTMTFVHATFVLVTFVQCPYQKYLSCHLLDFEQNLKVGCWDNILQMPIVMVTFVQETFVLAKFVHISNISPVTDPILAKLFEHNFWGP